MGIPQSEDGDFVEGIYNWCDRWCERCPMTVKCRQYAMECARDAFNADGSNDGDSAEFMEALMNTSAQFEGEAEAVADAEWVYDEMESGLGAGDEGEDFDMEAYMEEREKIEKATASTRCVRLADRYMGEAGRWLEEWEVLVDQLHDDDGELAEAVEVISWYIFQLSVKLRRAIHGKLEADEDFMDDVYGSAKVALIGADRSLFAWQLVQKRLPADRRDSVDLVIQLLKSLIQETEIEIPEARAFKRPGLD